MQLGSAMSLRIVRTSCLICFVKCHDGQPGFQRDKLSSLSCQCGPKSCQKPRRPSVAQRKKAAVELGLRESPWQVTTTLCSHLPLRFDAMHQHELPSTLLTCRSAEKSSDEMKCGVWRVKCEVWGVKSAVWSVKCGVWRKQWEVRSVKCGLWSVQCGVWSVDWGECSVNREVWSVDCEGCGVKCEVCQVWSVTWGFKCDMWNMTSVSQSARTHGLGWRTAHASSIDEKGLIYIFKATSAPPRAGTTGIPAPWFAYGILPDSLFMAYCPERPGEQRPTAPMGISTPSQRTGIVTRDPGSGVLRTLSPTPYRGDQVSAITALWAPNGLGMLRDGKQQYRRIY